MRHRRFSLRGRLNSFRYAGKGISLMIRTQHNAWIHTLATFAICGVALYAGISGTEWCAIILAIISVWTAEALNTALEFLADVASPDFHPLVEKAKDVAAGAVLISAIGATLIALIVVIPYLRMRVA